MRTLRRKMVRIKSACENVCLLSCLSSTCLPLCVSELSQGDLDDPGQFVRLKLNKASLVSSVMWS